MLTLSVFNLTINISGGEVILPWEQANTEREETSAKATSVVQSTPIKNQRERGQEEAGRGK